MPSAVVRMMLALLASPRVRSGCGDATVSLPSPPVYLVVFGSIMGYSAYIFAMDRLPVAIVSVYPYINAVVAMGVGWLFFREPFGLRELAAMLIIFSGVGVVKWQSAKWRSV